MTDKTRYVLYVVFGLLVWFGGSPLAGGALGMVIAVIGGAIFGWGASSLLCLAMGRPRR
ncbi:hypothetical protein H7K38_23500 [Mycobacterium alsense]|uniref:Uncharacterized protein n=1 Tax=Mycobacterium alsense TaxID=324058 RepID=A0AA41XTL2_9MYCO|nr:hypothetical protein [Mycobacterium alsense]MCV7381584.1 hypothetical protein [Mycobacterium alsense]